MAARLVPCVFATGALLASTTALADDWTQWRGPTLNGISTETGWKVEGREKPAWRAEVGLGYSTVSVAKGRVYTCGFDKEAEVDVVWCFDAETGEEVWAYDYPAKIWARAHGGGTLSTPSVDGDLVYVFNREANFSCFDAETGDLHWQENLKEKHGLTSPTWGFAASPLILEECVLLNAGKVLAFEKGTTKLLWESEKDYGHAYSTPTVCTLAGKVCLAVIGGDGLAVLVRRGGKELAFYPWKTRYDINAASPLIVGDDRVVIASGYGHGGAMLRFTGKELELLWESKNLRNHMMTTMLIGDHLYTIDEAVLRCFDLDGEELWSERGIGKGAMSAVGDRLLVMTGEGELAVIVANPEKYRELSRVKVTEGGVCWTMPILANGRIYCRNSLGQLVARDHRAQ